MPHKRLTVVVTRRLPEVVETRMSELFDVTLSPDDAPMMFAVWNDPAFIRYVGDRGVRTLEQARAVVRALIEGLGERDRLELVAFAMRPERWRRRAVRMTAAARRAALRWLDERQAGGGTEMADAVIEALRPLDGVGQRIWQSVSEGKTLGEIAGVISAEYEVEEAQALADLLEFTSDLVERGLLRTP